MQHAEKLCLVLCASPDGGQVVRAYASEAEAAGQHRWLKPPARFELKLKGWAAAGDTGTPRHKFTVVLCRDETAKCGEKLRPVSRLYGGKDGCSLLRSATQKLIRRQSAAAAVQVLCQNLRQLSMPGTLAANDLRQKLCKRLLIIAAEDAGLVPELGSAAFHSLAAKGKAQEALGFGLNDAKALGILAGKLALTNRPGAASAVATEAAAKTPIVLALALLLDNEAVLVQGRQEATWLSTLKVSLRCSPIQHYNCTYDEACCRNRRWKRGQPPRPWSV